MGLIDAGITVQNIDPTNYPSKARIREVMAIAVAMGKLHIVYGKNLFDETC
jgi:hypothetical protein